MALLSDGTIRLSLAMVSLVMLTAFLVIPNISAFLQKNLDYPRKGIEVLYMIGGAVSFVVLRLAGRAIDRFGAARVSIVGTVVLIAVLYFGFVAPETMGATGVLILFVGFMVGMSIRNVCMGSLSTRVPRTPDERAGYMSLQSTAQHISSSLGAFASSRLLSDGPGGRLMGCPGWPCCRWPWPRRCRRCSRRSAAACAPARPSRRSTRPRPRSPDPDASHS